MILTLNRGYSMGVQYADSNNWYELSQLIRALWSDTVKAPDAASTSSLDEYSKQIATFRSMASDIEDLKTLTIWKQKSLEKEKAAKLLDMDTSKFAAEIDDAQKQYDWRVGFLTKKLLDFNGVTEVDSRPLRRLY